MNDLPPVVEVLKHLEASVIILKRQELGGGIFLTIPQAESLLEYVQDLEAYDLERDE